MSRPRGAGARARYHHFSLSATDEEWEVVRSNAARRRVSMSRYLVELGLAEERAEEPGPPLALTPAERREVEEAVRALPALVEEMHDRVGALFDAWAAGMAREGRLDEVRAVVTERAGAPRAGEFLARVAAPAVAPAPHGARDPEPRSAPKEPPGQGTLNL